MKLAEALIERKALKTKMEELKSRIYKNAQTQEGDEPTEQPLELLNQLHEESVKFEKLIVRINKTNNDTLLNDKSTLMEALAKRDMLKYEHFILTNLANKATPATDRYSNREIKFISTIDVKEIRKKADDIAKQYRLIDVKIQEKNWLTDLV
jgi:hypothetical protein